MNNWFFYSIGLLILVSNWLAGGNVWTAVCIVAAFVLCQVDTKLELHEIEKVLDSMLARFDKKERG